MKYLIDSDDDVQKYTIVGADCPIEAFHQAKAVERAQLMVLKKFLGDKLYQAVLNNNSIAGLKDNDRDLLEISKRVVGWFATKYWLHFADTKFSAAGQHRYEGESFVAQFRRKEEANAANIEQGGYEAVEQLLDFLQENANYFTQWRESEFGRAYFNSLLPTAKALGEVVQSASSHLFYFDIISLIHRAEHIIVKPIIGEELYKHLLNQLHRPNEAEQAEKQLIQLLQNAIGFQACLQAVRGGNIRFDARGWLLSADYADGNSQQPDAQRLHSLANLFSENYGVYIQEIRRFLAKNPFPRYQQQAQTPIHQPSNIMFL